MPEKPPIQLLLFDLGGVIIDIEFRRVFEHWAPYSAYTADELAHRFEMDQAYQEHERGLRDKGAYFDHLRACLRIDADDETIERGWNAMFVGAISPTASLVERASAALPCFAFTNSNPTHEAYWRRHFHAVLRPFREVFVSSTLGERKPDAAAFALIAEATGISPDATVFFDDTEENVLGARAAGLQAVQVRGPSDVRIALERIVPLT